MARRGRFRRRASSGGFGRRFRRSRGRSRGMGGGLIQIDAMAYGALRPYVTNFAAPITNALPMGQYADNIVMGLGTWFLAKRGGMLGNIAKKGLVIENALVGSELSLNLMGGATSNGGGNAPMYG